MGIFDFFSKEQKKESLDKGLEKTKTSFFGQLSKAVVGKSTVDVEVLDELEDRGLASNTNAHLRAISGSLSSAHRPDAPRRRQHRGDRGGLRP